MTFLWRANFLVVCLICIWDGDREIEFLAGSNHAINALWFIVGSDSNAGTSSVFDSISMHRAKSSTCYFLVACVALTCSFLSWCVVMAEPRVLILGHSFIRRLHELVRLPTNALREDFDVTTPMNLRWHGVGARTVAKVIRYDLEIVR